MIMKKILKVNKSVVLLAISAAALILSGCSSNEQYSETGRENPSLKEAFKSKEGVSQEQFESDINESEKIQFCHRSDYVYESPYTINEYEIVKRQTNVDEKTDILYATLDLSNEYFDAIVDAEFEYEYYDVGGWILEDTKLTVNDVIPTRAPEGELAMDKLRIGDDPSFVRYTLEGYPEYKENAYDLYFNSASFNPITCVSGQYECCLNLQYETEYVVGTAMATMIFKNHKWYFNPEDEYNDEIFLITVLSCQEKTDGFFESLSGEYFKQSGSFQPSVDRYYTLYINIKFSDENVFPICNSHEVYKWHYYSKPIGYEVEEDGTEETDYTSIIDPIELITLTDIGAGGKKSRFEVDKNIIGCYDSGNHYYKSGFEKVN